MGHFFLTVLIVALFTAGCAEKGPILLNIGYREPVETAAATKVIVGVSPLKDVRGQAASVLGKRTIPSGQQNDLVVQGTVAELATASLKKALTGRGHTVKDVRGWDLSVEGMKTEGAALLLGGEIKALWLESTASALKTHLRVSVQLKIAAGYAAEKKVVRTIDVNSTLEQDVLYSREKLEDALSEALSSAIEQIFKDDEVQQRLR